MFNTTNPTKRMAPKKPRSRFGRAGGWSVETATRDWRRRHRDPIEQAAFMFADVPSANERWSAQSFN